MAAKERPPVEYPVVKKALANLEKASRELQLCIKQLTTTLGCGPHGIQNAKITKPRKTRR